MKRFTVGAATAVLAILLAVTGATVAGAAKSSNGLGSVDALKGANDDLPSALGEKQRGLVQQAMELKLQGKIAKDAKVAKLENVGKANTNGKGNGKQAQFVQLARTGEDTIWTVLAEFGPNQQTHNHGAFGVVNHAGTPGPLHNQIGQPDRALDNTTIWTSNFDKSYYEKLLFSDQPGFSSVRNFYIENSSGQYAVNGVVEDWVQLANNEAAYGSNYCGDIVCGRDIQRYLEDTLNAWYNKQVAAGKSDAEINAYLAQFDKWDRYDYDGDGDFNEPDGYIDHFQSIHAGVGEETGGGAQGTDAIWSHRSYVNSAAQGISGPSFNKLGGVQVGHTNLWVGDYTVEPENGGVGVFAHEFGHDLGIPDEYDTSGNTGGAENSTGFWTPWSSGSYGSSGAPDNGIGNRPFSMSAWDKLVFGWLNYDLHRPGEATQKITLGPSEAQTAAGAQAVIQLLPNRFVQKAFGQPFAGSKFYWSGTGNLMDNVMTKTVTLPAGSASLAAQVKYNIEEGWDYAYVIVSTDNGATWHTVHTNLSTDDNPNLQNFGEGITGLQSSYTGLTADLSAYAGQTVKLGFEYWTDPFTAGNGGPVTPGIHIDDIAISGQPVDGAETDAGWTFDPASNGFRATTGTETFGPYLNAYVIENRQYLGADRMRVGFDGPLGNAPYNFGGTVSPDWTERHPYEDGVLIWYWNTQYDRDNNVGDHPGEGQILPVDAHPSVMHWSDGTVVRPRIQSYDSTFGVKKTDAITLHKAGVATTFPSQPGVSVFNDTQDWWTASDPGDALGKYQASWIGVKVPKSGTQVKVLGNTKKDYTVDIELTPPPAS